MKRFFLIVAITMLASLYVNPLSTDAALVDGIHTINYQVNKPDSSSASIANDYFAKPAKLIVENGTMKVQITINNSAWVTELNPPGGLTVISTNPEADQRVVQFSINNFNPLRVGMTIDIDNINYHHSYGTDFVFFENSIQLVEAAPKPKPEENTQPNTGSQSSNNQGGESNNSQNNASQGSSSTNNSQSVTSNNSSSASANSSGNNSNSSAQSSDNENADDSTDASTQDEQTGEEQEQNPDTSDSFPVIYVLLLLAAVFVLVKNKNILKN